MPTVYRSALMPFPASAMFQIVNDVESYPAFLPWCARTSIEECDEVTMQASVHMKKGLLDHWFTTRNKLVKNRQIDMSLVDGPFRVLEGSWLFHQLGDDGCKIELRLHFEFSNQVATSVLTPLFSQIADTMVERFSSRAYEVIPH